MGACRPNEARLLHLADPLVGLHVIDIRVARELPELTLPSVVLLQLEDGAKLLLEAGPRRYARTVSPRTEEGIERLLGRGNSTPTVVNFLVRSWVVPYAVDHVRHCQHLGVAHIRHDALQIVPRVAGVSLLPPPGKTLVAEGVLEGVERDAQAAEVL